LIGSAGLYRPTIQLASKASSVCEDYHQLISFGETSDYRGPAIRSVERMLGGKSRDGRVHSLTIYISRNLLSAADDPLFRSARPKKAGATILNRTGSTSTDRRQMEIF